MRKFNFVLSALLFVASSNVWAYGTGYSTYPMMEHKKLLSAEMTAITSSGGGVGVQGRYTDKITDRSVVDAGLGLGAGKRSARAFVGYDYELFPDYEKQPRVSLKTTLENAREFSSARNVVSLAPTVSKGFNFWGQEAYPYVSLPFGVSLQGRNKTYETIFNAAVGATTKLPIDGYEHLLASAEASIDLKDSFTAIFLGVTFPLN